MTKNTPDNLAKAKDILKSNPSIDLHTHLGYWEGKGLSDIFKPATYEGDDKIKANVEEMIKGKCKSLFLCVTGDNPMVDLTMPGNKKRDYQGDEAWEEYQRQRSLIDDFCQKFPMEPATKIDDIDRIFDKGKLAVFLSTEGGHMVENDLGRMEQLTKEGVHRFQPIHYVHTKLGDNQTDPSSFGGLSPLGKEAIKEAVRLGMVVDAAHASYEAAGDMAKLTAGPIILSHTMMKYDSKRFGSYLENRPRFITQDHAFLIAQTDGVIGTWPVGVPYGTDGLESFAEATKMMVDTVGINHVGWATDYIDFAMADWELTNFFWQQELLDGRVAFVVGQVDVTDYVDTYGLVSPWTDFSNLAFSTDSTIPAPNQGLAAAASFTFTNNIYVLAGLGDANGDPTHPWEGFQTFFGDNEFFKHMEVGWFSSYKNRFENNIHLTGWQADARKSPQTPSGWGMAFSFNHIFADQWLPFLRLGYWDGGAGTILDRSVSVGIGRYMRRKSDVLGIGLNWGRPSEETFGPALRDQYTAELFYRLHLLPHLTITPDVQLVVNPALNPSEDQIWVFGLRARLDF